MLLFKFIKEWLISLFVVLAHYAEARALEEEIEVLVIVFVALSRTLARWINLFGFVLRKLCLKIIDLIYLLLSM